MLSLIASVALALGFDARLAQEVALKENPALDPAVISVTGDLGLMQINSDYLDYYLDMYWYGDRQTVVRVMGEFVPFQWANPKHNAYLGIRILKDLVHNPYINTWQALIAYNCGLARLKSGLVPESSVQYATDIYTAWLESKGVPLE